MLEHYWSMFYVLVGGGLTSSQGHGGAPSRLTASGAVGSAKDVAGGEEADYSRIT